MGLTGFSVVRNAHIMGYPWLECYQAIIPYVDHFVLSEGYSDDDTWLWCQRLRNKYGEKVELIRYHWPTLPTGFAIGEATSDCVHRCEGEWLLYVQADELWHPDSLAVVQSCLREKDYPEDVDGFSFNYLHLEYNCQELQGGGTFQRQEGAGYQRAIRLVRNAPYIHSHRDAWTFEGCRRVAHFQLEYPIVHINYFLYHDVPSKRRRQAEEFYPDLGHYVTGAAKTEREWIEHKEVPEKFLQKTSPFQKYLNPLLWPLLGTLRYEPALERGER